MSPAVVACPLARVARMRSRRRRAESECALLDAELRIEPPGRLRSGRLRRSRMRTTRLAGGRPPPPPCSTSTAVAISQTRRLLRPTDPSTASGRSSVRMSAPTIPACAPTLSSSTAAEKVGRRQLHARAPAVAPAGTWSMS